MSESTPEPTEPAEASEPIEPAVPEQETVFTKEAQPELSAAQRREKAGITRNRIVLWGAGIALALYLIITGIVGILTKAR